MSKLSKYNYNRIEKCYHETWEIGSHFYVNIINSDEEEFDSFKKYIQEGCIIPDIEELKQVILPEALADYITGKYIFPQMSYYKIR